LVSLRFVCSPSIVSWFWRAKRDGFSTALFVSKNGSFLELKPKSCRVFNGNTLFSGNKKKPSPPERRHKPAGRKTEVHE